MGKRSSILKELNADIVSELNERIDAGRETIDDITDWLLQQAPDAMVSRSAVGRYVQRRRAQEKAVEILASVTDLPPGTENEAADLMMQLAALRIKEAKILERLKILKII